jgi:predicted small lipoprotein YifL
MSTIWIKFSILILVFTITGCGVKGPPLPPEPNVEEGSVLVEDKDTENSKKKSKKQSK